VAPAANSRFRWEEKSGTHWLINARQECMNFREPPAARVLVGLRRFRTDYFSVVEEQLGQRGVLARSLAV
jgi:hypothetical protein